MEIVSSIGLEFVLFTILVSKIVLHSEVLGSKTSPYELVVSGGHHSAHNSTILGFF